MKENPDRTKVNEQLNIYEGKNAYKKLKNLKTF